jgi:hypothetical protein
MPCALRLPHLLDRDARVKIFHPDVMRWEPCLFALAKWTAPENFQRHSNEMRALRCVAAFAHFLR